MSWSAKFIKHRKEERIAVYFEKNPEWIARIKKINGARWSATLKVWHLPNTLENRLRFKIHQPKPSKEGVEQLEKFKFWLQAKRYSINTINSYGDALKSFFSYYENRSISSLTNDDVIAYHNHCILKKEVSASLPTKI